MRIRSIVISGVAASAAIALGTTSAYASVTVDANGKGFIGKGEVQNALGMNNSALQKAVDAKSLVFTAKQSTSQTLSKGVTQAGSQSGSQAGTQEGTQAGTRAATQTMSQDLVCTFTNGNGTKTFHRDGVRDGDRTGTREGSRNGIREGSRDGERDGTRTGTQSGVQKGSIAYDLDVEARKSNQYTGFILNGWKGQSTYTEGVTTWNAPVFGEYTFGDYSFGAWSFSGDYSFGEYEFGAFKATGDVKWGEWDAAPGENPDDCLRSSNADKITAISNVVTPGAVTDGAVTDGVITDGAITPGAVTDGAVTDGAVTDGAVTSGAVTPNGPVQVFVNGKAL